MQGPVFRYPGSLVATCSNCNARLAECKLYQKGHSWAGKAASVYSEVGAGFSGIALSKRRDVQARQGKITVETVSCAACKTWVGWKFVASPTEGEAGKVGLALDAVSFDEKKGRALTLESTGGDSALDKLARAFMGEKGTLGLTLAYGADAKDSKIHARAWGFKSETQKLGIDTPVRIASVSKPITATAIGLLVQTRKLSFDSKVMPILRKTLLGEDCRLADDRMESITIRHLLDHSSGLPTNDGSDPMFRNPRLDHKGLITHCLTTRSLYAEPGRAHKYSNFGYCVLGRVIEAITGSSYESWVLENVLSKCGVDKTEAFVRREVVPCAYAVTQKDEKNGEFIVSPSTRSKQLVERMDSHGGWHMTPSALVKFSKSLANGALLDKDVKSELFKPSNVNSRYALGFHVNSHAQFHSGSLGNAGTRSILVHTSSYNGWSWALVGVSNGAALDPFGWKYLRTLRGLGAAQKK